MGLVWKEVERRSIYSLLTKPVRRHEFIIGKFAGLALTLFINVATMTVVFYAVLAYIYDYLEGLNQVPTVVNNLARLQDVRRRLELVEAD